MEMEKALWFGQGGEVVFWLCENEGVKMGLYRSGGAHGSVMYGWVWEGKWFEFEW